MSGPRQGEVVRRALEVRVEGEQPFQAVQATWNLLEPSVGAALAEAGAAGWGVIVKEALANGRLTSRGRGRPAEVLGRAAGRHGVGIDAVALAAALAQPWADVVLSGAVTLAQLHSNLEALRLALGPGEAEEWAGLAERPEEYWAVRSELPWD